MGNELDQLLSKIKQFRDERDWKQFHNNKDMAISLVLEAAELLEHFQWKKEDDLDDVAKNKREEIKDEIADVFMYLLEMADNLDIDIIDAANKKLKKNEIRYPLRKSRGNAKKYTEL